MTTIGEYLRRFRRKRKLTIEELSKSTKIKRSYIDSIEKENWRKLPEFPVVQGFVKSISDSLGANRNQAVALLRRDYPPKRLPINPKPDVADKIKWNPRLAFSVGVVAVILLVAVYLVYQYVSFNNPPKLLLDKPSDGERVLNSQLIVSGKTDPDVIVTANNQPILVAEDGSFFTEIEVFEGTEEIVVVAKSRTGKEEIVKRNVNVELDEEEN